MYRQASSSYLVFTRCLTLCILAAVYSCPAVVVAWQPDSPGYAVQHLEAWLQNTSLSAATLPKLLAEPFSSIAITKPDAEAAADLLWKNRSQLLRQERAAEMEARSITIGDKTMPFWFKVFGDKPNDGRSLFISMHGGGGAPAKVNDQQYENQKKLYQPEEGVYLVPRAPTNAWNLWHTGDIDDFFDRLITNMVIFNDVNPDRVYLMGYSAGGDGVYQLAPRMSDRFAAASMMAGHPNETQPDGLRNIGFTIHVGAQDSAYNRNKIAGEWKLKLSQLQQADPEGYVHYVELHAGREHWMNLEDSVAVTWMAKFNRKRFPRRVVWMQDDVFHSRFYWLQTDRKATIDRAKIVAETDGNEVHILESQANRLTVLLHDDLLDMNFSVAIKHRDILLFQGDVSRTIGVVATSLLDRDEPGAVMFGRVHVAVPLDE